MTTEKKIKNFCLSYCLGIPHPEGIKTGFRNAQFYQGEVEKCDVVIIDCELHPEIAKNYAEKEIEVIDGAELKEKVPSPPDEKTEAMMKDIEAKYKALDGAACDLVITQEKIEVDKDANLAAKQKAIIQHFQAKAKWE